MRAAPPTYDRQDQQDVRNEIQRQKKDLTKPVPYILISDKDDGSLWKIEVESGVLGITAAST